MLRDLRLQHFRSYADASFEFEPGVNIIVGANASGKTNLLEAILVLGQGSSYRAKDQELIAFEEPWARLDTHLDNGAERTLKLNRGVALSKRFELEGKPYIRLSLAQTLPVVLFEPNHLQLLSGSPEQRRTYLDDLLERTLPGYGTLRRQYRRTLTQRNALLKGHAQPTEAQLFPWNVRLSHLAGQVVRARSDLVEQMNERLGALYHSLTPKNSTEVKLKYQARWPLDGYESAILKKLEANMELDRARGFTGAGPHREDFVVLYDNHPAAETASRGETRTTVLVFKILELQLLEIARGQVPLLLLDDVFSELDGSRRRALTEHLQDYQTFITTTDADIVTKHFSSSTKLIAIDTYNYPSP